ncbi:hypothetical protein NPIL_85251 [Nephila pilipes]|uniref:Uncharacterized protein n=1 Tax=Nephila pilipes TaxID=299642 RepID=A0A8X6UGU3_NEPPI|nr:hypothetical protein NPIL_85251 [Nephila pilipes]
MPSELLFFVSQPVFMVLDVRLDLIQKVKERDFCPIALHVTALETIHTHFPPNKWLHIYNDGPFWSSLRVLTQSRSVFRRTHCVPDSPRSAAVAMFRLLTEDDYLSAYLFRFNIINSPVCILCDSGQVMTAEHLDECSLNHLNCIVKKYWRARCRIT